MKVQLLFFPGCPNAEAARRNLQEAFARLGLRPRWEEVDVGAPSAPAELKGWASPTVLVNGRDVGGVKAPAAGGACRLYPGSGDAPSVEVIARAFAASSKRSGGLASLGVLPALGAALLPVGACPACWPAYAAALSPLGLGLLLQSSYLLPATVLLLAVGLGALAWRARERRGLAPFAAGLLGAGLVLLGKFGLGSDPVAYGGIAVLLGASFWNAWPRRSRPKADACPACASSQRP